MAAGSKLREPVQGTGDKGLIPRIYQRLKKNSTTKQPPRNGKKGLKKWEKDFSRQFSKEGKRSTTNI